MSYALFDRLGSTGMRSNMLSSDGSEFDVFFDSAEVLSVDESVVEDEDVEFGVWSCEPESVERRRGRFLEKMGLFEFVPKDDTDGLSSSDLTCFERISGCRDGGSHSSDSSVDGGEGSLRFCGREQNCGSNSMSDDDLEGGNSNNEEDESSVECETPKGERLKQHGSFSKKRTKKWMLKCFVGAREGKKGKGFGYEASKPSSRSVSEVKVQVHKKAHQELSAAYKAQEIRGHKGVIWAMKFSPDGKFLATGGEDGVVRIWRVTLSDSLRSSFTREARRSLDEASPGLANKKIRSQPLVMLPEKVLHIEEAPVQELHGHTGDVLDLAWSDSNFLLSASEDKTVRLWQTGRDHCLHVFHHNNYVTCVQFNPVNKNYFISGSIDGKARIWGLFEERVVAWTDVRDAISAICYKPDGEGFVVGSITGTCRFYQTSGNDVEMEEQIRVKRRNKPSGNRINGLQFCPESPDKLLVSSDDSKLRIFHRNQILQKFKGAAKSGTHSASFVSAGKHILSIGEDSRVHLWNNDGSSSDAPQPRSPKNARSSRSCECFHSPGVSVAAAWPGTAVSRTVGDELREALRQVRCSANLSRSCRVSATWPEEKLPKAGEQNDGDAPLDGRIYDITPHGGAWGMVIATAGWDGMIRMFHNYGLTHRL